MLIFDLESSWQPTAVGQPSLDLLNGYGNYSSISFENCVCVVNVVSRRYLAAERNRAVVTCHHQLRRKQFLGHLVSNSRGTSGYQTAIPVILAPPKLRQH